MKQLGPIGIFDSGVGGTSIWKEIHHLLPHEDTIYLADSVNAPYGHKSEAEIISLSIKNTEFLLQQGAKIIVVACNTATTNAIDILRKRFKTQFIGIEPAIKPAALLTYSKSIGILATKGTLNSSLFHKTSEEYAYGIKVTEIIGEGLVPLIEKGELNSPAMSLLLTKFMEPMMAAEIDYLVLGCSHYPYLIPQLEEILPAHVKIIDSGQAVARQTKSVLEKNDLLVPSQNKPTLSFYSNTSIATLKFLLKEFSSEILLEKKEF